MRLPPLARVVRGLAFDLASGAVLVLGLLVVLFTFADYGMSWDEPYAMVYGRQALAFFASFGQDRAATHGINALRAPTFQLTVEAVASSFAGEHGLLVRRIVTPLVGWLGLLGTWRLARLLGGPAVGLLATASLLLTPIYYGHMFINPTDLPFAVAYVWALDLGARLVLELPRPSARALVAAGLVCGITIGLRIGGLVVLAYVLALLAARVAKQPRVALGYGAALLAISYAGMIAFWPTAWLHPLRIAWASARQAVAYPKHEPVLLAGTQFWSDALPWFYQPVYLLAQLPEQLLLTAAIGLCVAFAWLRRGFRARAADRWVPAAMVLLATAVPLACACLLRPVDYDGMRHLLFVVPPLACLAALGIAASLRRFARQRVACALAVAVLAGCTLHTLSTMRALHPYEYVYYNPTSGGLRGAQARFELDYWITSFAEAVDELDHALDAERYMGLRKRPYRLAVCGHAAVAYMYLPDDVVLTPHTDDADFLLATTKWNCQDRYAGQVVVEVQRMGIPFAVVKRLRPALLTASADR